MKKVKVLTFLFLVAATFLWNCGSNSPLEPSGPGPNEVWIQGGQFNPTSLTVSPKTTVTWINKDNDTRDVQSGAEMSPTTEFASPNIDPNKTFSHTFPIAGIFNYYSVITGATGVIIVQTN